MTLRSILVIDKEVGYTSMDVCAIIRGRLRRGGAPKGVKVGHGGTLDPLATGVLVVLLGQATRLCDEVMAGEKRYEATIDLAHRSATDDAEGPIEPVEVARVPSAEEVRSACARFVGKIEQAPPAFSAIHVGGRRAYDLAREGKPVPIATRVVEVMSLEVRSYDWPRLEVSVACGKGTYIRSLARDIGGALGTGGMLSALRRTRVGQFDIAQAVTLAQVADPLDPGLLAVWAGDGVA